MNDECIVWEMPDGAVIYATCPASYKKNGETRQQWLLRAFNKTVSNPIYVGAVRILKPLMPDGSQMAPGKTKLFYDAWRHEGGGKINIDMPAAREIKLNRIRFERNEKLKEGDGPALREMEQGTANKPWIDYKQKLRDLPATFDLDTITTPEELNSFTPVWPTQPRG